MVEPGFYISNEQGSYWNASDEQVAAIQNYYQNYIYKYSGQGSSYWMVNDKAVDYDVEGINNKYVIEYTGSDIFIQTSDNKFRHILEIKSPPTL
jgi:hypothetical protein